ncbi:MAG TPA: hypothetical protein PLP31_01470 [Thermoanaerobaculaceae bacterium]|nr:hypothetical protein [Thermoanaerobaculaceae bacterium]
MRRLYVLVLAALVPAAAAQARVRLFPGVARLPGANGTVWRSDGVLHNPGPSPQKVTLELIPRGGSAVSTSTTVQLQPGETRTIPSVYDLLGAPDGAGVLRVTGEVGAWFRAYNQGAQGTFGQDLPPIAPTGGSAASTVTTFAFASPQSTASDFRSNLLLVNLDSKPVTFTISAAGKTKTTNVPAGANTQINNLGAFLGTPKGFFAASVTADGRWYAVVSTVDPITGDPTTVRGLAPVPQGQRLFPGVAKLAGANQTAWRTEATFANPATTAASLRLALIPRGSSHEVASRTVTLAGGEALRVADLYAFLNVPSGAGMLKVTGAALAWVRTFNQGVKGTFGQDLAAVGEGEGVSANTPVLFPFESPADPRTGFRSNLAVLNLETRDITVTMRAGSRTGSKPVPAGSYVQVDNLGGFLGTPIGTEPVWVSADGRWAGTISTIDPVTGDPMTVRGEESFAPPSSYDLIEKARASRVLTDEQALLYSVWADHRDPRLPAAYRGDDRFLEETDSLPAATSRWGTLSVATRDAIGPFLAPPFVAGSWWDLRRGGAGSVWTAAPPCRPWEAGCPILADWEYKQGPNVRVWYLKANASTDAATAQGLVNEVEQKIWQDLAGVLQRWPLQDGWLGGSPHLDIALVDGLPVPARTRPADWNACKKTAAYILLSRSEPAGPRLNSLLAHELMHAAQLGYDMAACIDAYHWLREPIAVWFEDYVYPDTNREHSYADNYLDEPHVPMDAFGNDREKLHAYGAYLFFQYLTRIRGADPSVIRHVWEATQNGDAYRALEAGLKKAGAPLDQTWPAFGVYAWNAAQPFDKFAQKDKMSLRAAIQDSFPMSLSGGDGFYEVAKGDDIELPRLSTRYFVFDFPDDHAAVVGFFNALEFAVKLEKVEEYGDVFSPKSPGTAPKGLHVRALVKVGGTWKEEDWTGWRHRSLCRMKASEKLESLVVILSNSSVDVDNNIVPQGDFSPLVWVSNFGCGPWEGSATLTYRWGDGPVETMTVSNFRIEGLGDGYTDDDGGTPLFQSFVATAGSYQWNLSGSDANCSYQGSSAGLVSLWPAPVLFTHPWVVAGPAHRAFVSELFQPWTLPVTVTETCGSPPKSRQIPYAPANFVLGTVFDNPWKKVSNDGKTWVVDASKIDKHLSGTWRLEAKRQP